MIKAEYAAAININTLSIAGLPLHIKGRHIGPLPGVLANFLIETRRSFRKELCLDADMFFPKKYSIRSDDQFNDRLLAHIYSQILATERGLLLHATAVTKEEKAYIFFGTSGGGKSTVAALSMDHAVLGDDVIAVRKIDGSFYALPTPWRQSGFVISDRHVKSKVAAIFFINKSKRIYFEPLTGEEALCRMLRHHIHFFRHSDAPLTEKMFRAASELAKAVPAYEMEFKKDEDFWGKLLDRQKTIDHRP